MIHFILLAICTVVLISCGNKQQRPVDANEAYYDSIKNLTGLQFDERLNHNDSAIFILYDNPDGEAKRYTRFYKEYNTADSSMIAVIENGCKKKFSRLEQIKSCRSEGKIHLFESGRPKQTLYFSNRGDNCNHLYFIKDGWFYYMDMDSATAGLIRQVRPLAIKPEGDSTNNP